MVSICLVPISRSRTVRGRCAPFILILSRDCMMTNWPRTTSQPSFRRRMSSASSTRSQWATEPNVNDVQDTAKDLASLREYIIQCGSKPASHPTTQCNPSRLLRSSLDKPGEIEQAEPLPHSSKSTFRCHHNKAVGLQLHESSFCATEKGSAESGLLGRLSRPDCVAHGDGWLVERRLAQIPARCRHESRKRLASLY